MAHDPSRLVLGTAQLGMAYGIANALGRPNRNQSREIVARAWDLGIREFDTASEYGDGETVLGAAFRSLGIADRARVVTKLPVRLGSGGFGQVEGIARTSLERLGVPALHGLLLHREEHIDAWERDLGRAMVRLKEKGLARGVGASVYGPGRAGQVCAMADMDMLQIPSNVFDRRFEGLAGEACGCALYVRSAFLQGAVFLDPESEDPAAGRFAPWLRIMRGLCADLGAEPHELALAYVLGAFPEAKVLIGAESAAQVEADVRCLEREMTLGELEAVQSAFPDCPASVVDPRMWN